ncbi:uncharacterized protein METZ01_LOCUS502734, partial [marine metagenome]
MIRQAVKCNPHELAADTLELPAIIARLANGH